MYDAIVIGARCTGSPTAMLLARRGFKVLLVDKATFPSDTISTHILWPHGAEILGRWGLLQRSSLEPSERRRTTFSLSQRVPTTRISVAFDRTISSCTSGSTSPLVVRQRMGASIW